jgi:outer membrane protein insertion porin family
MRKRALIAPARRSAPRPPLSLRGFEPCTPCCARLTRAPAPAQYARTLNFGAFNHALSAINSWYEERGIFGQVVDADLSEGGICELKVAEAIVAKVTVRTLHKDTGEPVAQPRTRPEVVTRALTTRPGCVYSVRRARHDLDAVYSTGIFEDVSLVPSASADEPGKLDLVVNVVERRTGGFSAGGGMSARGLAEGALSGVVGSCAYTQKNLFGLNQKLTASVELGQVDSLYRFSHVDPWVRSDPHRTSRVISVQNTRSNGNAIHGRGPEPPTPEQAAVAAGRHAAGAEVVVQRLMASCEYSRPLSRGWTGTTGVTWQRSGLRDETGQQIILDAYGKHLTFSTTAQQDVMALGLVSTLALHWPAGIVWLTSYATPFLAAAGV